MELLQFIDFIVIVPYGIITLSKIIKFYNFIMAIYNRYMEYHVSLKLFCDPFFLLKMLHNLGNQICWQVVHVCLLCNNSINVLCILYDILAIKYE